VYHYVGLVLQTTTEKGTDRILPTPSTIEA